MKALVMLKPGEVAIQEKAKPVPGEGEVLLKVLRVGVCGSDLHAYKGIMPFLTYPRVVGHELAVEVAEIPPSAKAAAKGYKEGDRVAVLPYLACGKCIACRGGKPNCCVDLKVLGVHIEGGMQEYITVPAGYVVPAGRVSLEDLPVVECFSIGFHSVRRANPRPGEAAVVVGVGPIGLGVIHGLKERGARVIAMDINDKRLAYAKEVAKADLLINSKTADPVKALSDLTGGENAPVVIDATGVAASMMKSFDFVSLGGALVYAGLITADITFADALFHRKEMSLLASRNATFEDFRNVIAGLESGRISTKGFVTHTASLEKAAQDFPAWLKPETGVIKAVVEMR